MWKNKFNIVFSIFLLLKFLGVKIFNISFGFKLGYKLNDKYN